MLEEERVSKDDLLVSSIPLLERSVLGRGLPLAKAFLAAMAALLLSFLILPGILMGVSVVGMAKDLVVNDAWLGGIVMLGMMLKIRSSSSASRDRLLQWSSTKKKLSAFSKFVSVQFQKTNVSSTS